MKKVLLDTFCGAGGAGYGYSLAGFEVIGVDINKQPNYPFKFYQGDAIEFIYKYGSDFDLIHASPPCQAYSATYPLSNKNHPKLIDETREALILSKKLYVIENVVGAPLINPLMLCGTMFNLQVQRHRLFEISKTIWFPPFACNHYGKATGNRARRHGITKTPSIERDGLYKFVTIAGNNYLASEGRAAMQINWMTKKELTQAIPPAYTKWLGEQLITKI